MSEILTSRSNRKGNRPSSLNGVRSCPKITTNHPSINQERVIHVSKTDQPFPRIIEVTKIDTGNYDLNKIENLSESFADKEERVARQKHSHNIYEDGNKHPCLCQERGSVVAAVGDTENNTNRRCFTWTLQSQAMVTPPKKLNIAVQSMLLSTLASWPL